MLRFSYQAPSNDRAFQRALLCVEHDPLAPIGALFEGSSGVVLVTHVSPELHLEIADAVAAVLGSKQIQPTDIYTGEGA